MLERLRKFKLTDDLTLIVENNSIYQRDLKAEAYFTGIWPQTGGPVAKTWLRADCPAQAHRMEQQWANAQMAGNRPAGAEDPMRQQENDRTTETP